MPGPTLNEKSPETAKCLIALIKAIRDGKLDPSVPPRSWQVVYDYDLEELIGLYENPKKGKNRVRECLKRLIKKQEDELRWIHKHRK